MISTRKLSPHMPKPVRDELAKAYRVMRAEGLMLPAKQRCEIVQEARRIFHSEAQPLSSDSEIGEAP